MIDYDRLTLKGDSDYYVSFDNEKVGKLQGEGLVECLGDKAEAASRRGAQRLADRQQRDAVQERLRLRSSTRSSSRASWNEVADQSVPDWDNQKALTIFEQMLQKADNKVDGVLAANDGLGNAAISALKQRKLDQIPVTGQDATLQGIQNIVAGDQCMTVYKAIKKEADAAAKLAIALAKGETPDGAGQRSTTARRTCRRCSWTPVAVTKDNIKDYLGEPDFPKKEEICAGKLAADVRRGRALGRYVTRSPGRRRRAPRARCARGGENDHSERPARSWSCAGSRRASARSRRSTRSTSTSPPARSWRSSATTAPASRR